MTLSTELEDRIMGYENAPATAMVATVCVCCQTALVDAKSVEIGMGPVCRKKHGYNVEVGEDARKQANVIIHYLACERFPADLAEKLAELEGLGFQRLVAILMKRKSAAQVTVSADATVFEVRSKYDVEFVNALRAISGRRWNGEAKCWTIPVHKVGSLYAALRGCYAGKLVVIADKPVGIDTLPVMGDLPAPDAPADAPKLAAPKIRLSESRGWVSARTPYDAGFVARVKAIRGRQWDSMSKCWLVPAGRRNELVAALRVAFNYDEEAA
jgi:hypothetical protein